MHFSWAALALAGSGLPRMMALDGGSLVADAAALRAALRRRRPEKLRSVVARSRSASSLAGGAPASWAPRTQPGGATSTVRVEEAFGPVEMLGLSLGSASVPRLPAPRLAEGGGAEAGAPGDGGGDGGDAAARLVRGLVGEAGPGGLLESSRCKRRLAALLSKPEAVGDRPPRTLGVLPGAAAEAPGLGAVGGVRVAGLQTSTFARLDASGACTSTTDEALVALGDAATPREARGKVAELSQPDRRRHGRCCGCAPCSIFVPGGQ